MAKNTYPTWHDTTSYSQGEVCGEVEPRTWTLTVAPDLTIKVHHYIGCGGQWFVSCHAVNISQCPLVNILIEDAKSEAVSIIFARLSVWLIAVKKLDPSKKWGGLYSG